MEKLLVKKEGIYLAVNTNLKQIRMEHKINQEELAHAVGAHPKSISRIERGENTASLELALRLSQYFNRTVEEIFFVE